MFKIEKNIEITKRKKRQRNNLKYPFNEMEVGDSFLVPVGDEDERVVQRRLVSACKYKKVDGIKFKTRCLCDGVRVWRVM